MLLARGSRFPEHWLGCATYRSPTKVEQQIRIKQVINLKAAKTLGLTIPPSLLITSDEVIE